MSQIRILNARDIESIFTLKDAIEAVEQAYLEKHRGGGALWPMVFHEFEHGVADLDIKSGNLDAANVFGLKVVSWYGRNPEKGLPALYGTALLFDLATGAPRALLNASAITDLRTGAAGAIGAKYLARRDSRSLLMVGCGALAPYLIAATLYVLPHIESVCIVNPHTPARAQASLPAIAAAVERLLAESGAAHHARFTSSENIAEAVGGSDIILTATPAYSPMVRAEWIKPGTHFSCVGADMSGKEEIDPEIFRHARVFGDDQAQCFAVGECEVPYKQGILSKLQAEIGAVLAGDDAGRTDDAQITVFDSTGIALQDLSSASLLLRAAQERRLGQLAEL